MPKAKTYKTLTDYTLKKQGVVALTSDVVAFTVLGESLNVLLIERGSPPFKKQWALPGGFMRRGETLEKTAARELREETGVGEGFHMTQISTWSEPKRDPRGRVVSTIFVALVDSSKLRPKADTDAAKVAWFPARKVPKPLAFDHGAILKHSLLWLEKALYDTRVVDALIPKRFSLSELQGVHEAVLGHTLDKRNFRKQILASGTVKETKAYRTGAHRPAKLYRFA